MRMALAGSMAGLTLVLGASVPEAQAVTARSLLARAQLYLATWEPALAAIVAEERYAQSLDLRSGVPRSEKRTLTSEVLLVRAPGTSTWMLFRDVLSVDGNAVRDRQRRFDRLFAQPEDMVAGARRIAAESARYNIGHVARNLNTPTTALVFLHEPFFDSTIWRKPERTVEDGVESWAVRFEQRRAPFAIRSEEGDPQPAAGRLWIDAASGRIHKTELDMWTVPGSGARQRPRARATITAVFGPVPNFDIWVPVRMEEHYIVMLQNNLMIERIEGSATYTNHRQFQTSARIIDR